MNTALCTLDAADLRLALPNSGRVEASYGPAMQMYGLVVCGVFNPATPIQHRVTDGLIDAASWLKLLPNAGIVTVYETDGEFLLAAPANMPTVAKTVTLPRTQTLTPIPAISALKSPVVPAGAAKPAIAEPDVMLVLRQLLKAAQNDVIRYGNLCYELWLPGKLHKVLVFCGVGYTLVTEMFGTPNTTPEEVKTTRYRELTVEETKALFEKKKG